MTEPTAPSADDFEEKLRALDEHWGPIIAQDEANAVIVKAKTNATLEHLDAQIQDLVGKADANFQVLRSLDPALGNSAKGVIDNIKEIMDLQLPMPPLGQFDQDEGPLK